MADVQTLSTDELRQRLERGDRPQLWNVLATRHCAGELIPGSRRMALDTIEQQATAVPKDAEIIHERVGTGRSGETRTTVAIHELLLRTRASTARCRA